MVIKIDFTHCFLLLITIILGSESTAQGQGQYQSLSKYHKWGIMVGPVLYNKAKLSPQYGDYTFENKSI
jgi:hypothetical protein